MPRGILTLEEAARRVHLDPNELRHFAQRGELSAIHREGQWRFEVRALNEWAQRNLLSSDSREQGERCADVEKDSGAFSLLPFFSTEAVELSMGAKAKGGVLRDLTDLACSTGRVWETERLFEALSEREDSASTAIGRGCAFPHARFLDPYMFESAFIAYARSPRGVYFGSPDGDVTRHFFLVCSTEHEVHLKVLARLSELVRKTPFTEELDAVSEAEDVIGVVERMEDLLR